MKKWKVGDFVKYRHSVSSDEGVYGLIIKSFTHNTFYAEFQVIWFNTGNNYDLSGERINGKRPGCRVIKGIPKYIKDRTEEALLWLVDKKRDFDNLDLIEVLAKVKNK